MTKKTTSNYQPSAKILEKYAQVLVNFALNSGEGVKPKEVVQIMVPDVAKELGRHLRNTILMAGAYPALRLLPTGIGKDFYDLANDDQLTFFPKKYIKSKVDLIDHSIGVIADPDPFELAEVKPAKIIKTRDSQKLYRDWLNKKESAGKFTWTMGLWGVEAKAKAVGLSLKEYWQQIIKACYLDVDDPIKKWREILVSQKKIRQTLDEMKIEKVHVVGKNTDLWVKIGADRVWNGGSGRNIPSFEIFTSPDWRGIEGYISFNEPFYRYGNVIEDIFLRLKNGKVIEAKAKKGSKLLQAMIKSKNANKLGEFSLTDGRISRITHPMAEILYDENMGGRYGNMHVAIGMSYHDCFRGDPNKVSKKEWQKRGFNDAAEHSDFVQTTNRIVTAILPDGSEKIIYKNGQFTIDS